MFFRKSSVKNLSASELNQMVKDGPGLVLVDVREPWEYQQGHVPNTVHIPLGQLPAKWSKLDPQQPTVLICEHGSRSQSAAAFLERNGFTQLYNLRGGTEAWRRSGLPLSRK